MMLWRSETVIVFHKIATNVSKAVTTQTTCHEEVRPIIRFPMGAAAKAKASDGPLPNLAETFGAKNPPIVPPIAPAVPKMAKMKTVVCKTSWANKI